ncbi:MAG: PhoH family protein [Gammaproteobacteria bacterium]|nr:MAG: PhoH family protein [Gammaproteobacteria bacterium]
MNAKIKQISFRLRPDDNARLASLCGGHDEHLRQIETYTGVEIGNRGNQFQIVGEITMAASVERLLHKLYDDLDTGSGLSASDLHLAMQQMTAEGNELESDDPETHLRLPKHVVKGRSPKQRQYIRNILTHDINFGIGPAGTGKTYLAVACAVEALQQHRVQRILLVRPAVEAGERLGFLPGDLEQKVDPYLRPLYDALHDMLGFEKVGRLLERNVIELAPLAYMRGRTLNESFIILDEAQNTTGEQMKMFLTRIGFGTTAVINGDITQIDLSRPSQSGLKQIVDILQDVKGISFTHFSAADVVRHHLVQKIIEAYEKHSKKKHDV